MTALIGLSRTDKVPADATLEVTWGSPTFGIGALFHSYFADVYNKVSPAASLFPLSASGVIPGDQSAVIAFGNRKERFASEIVSALESLDNNFVEVRSVRLLSGAAKAQANTAAGALSRDKAVTAANEAAQRDSLTGKLGDLFANLGTVAKWAAIVVVVVVVGLVIMKVKK